MNGKKCKTHSRRESTSGVWRNMLVIQSPTCLKFGANTKEMRFLKKENILVNQERHQRIMNENA